MKITLLLALIVVVLLVSVEGGRRNRKKNNNRKPKPDCSAALDTGVTTCTETPGERFYYNAATSQCEAFQYTGCGGNGNNFPNLNKCNKKCSRRRPSKGKGKGRPERPRGRGPATTPAGDDDEVSP